MEISSDAYPVRRVMISSTPHFKNACRVVIRDSISHLHIYATYVTQTARHVTNQPLIAQAAISITPNTGTYTISNVLKIVQQVSQMWVQSV